MDELQGNKFETATLKTSDDVADESPLNTVGLERSSGEANQHTKKSPTRRASGLATHLDHDVGTLSVVAHDFESE